MKIRKSRNLKYDKTAKVVSPEEYEKEDLEPRVCILESFERQNGNLKLYFRNKSQALLRAVNTEGFKEINHITQGLDSFMGRSYEEILETEF